MASYTAPPSNLPYVREADHSHSHPQSHSRSYSHSHSHSRSHAPSHARHSHSRSNLAPAAPPMGPDMHMNGRPAGPNGLTPEAIDSEGYSRSRTGFEAGGARHSRGRAAPPPINTSVPQSWKDEGAGSILMTPGTSTLPVKYQLPEYEEMTCAHDHDHDHDHDHHDHHDHDHDHDHNHGHGHSHSHSHAHAHAHSHDHGGAEKSLVTRTLLKYCTSWPLLHAIIVEKDSRRIFYFMRYLLFLCSPQPPPGRGLTAGPTASTSHSCSSRPSTATSPTR